MKAVIGRGLVLSFLFIAITAVYIDSLGLPLEESWFAFYELQFADVPLGCGFEHDFPDSPGVSPYGLVF